MNTYTFLFLSTLLFISSSIYLPSQTHKIQQYTIHQSYSNNALNLLQMRISSQQGGQRSQGSQGGQASQAGQGSQGNKLPWEEADAETYETASNETLPANETFEEFVPEESLAYEGARANFTGEEANFTGEEANFTGEVFEVYNETGEFRPSNENFVPSEDFEGFNETNELTPDQYPGFNGSGIQPNETFEEYVPEEPLINQGENANVTVEGFQRNNETERQLPANETERNTTERQLPANETERNTTERQLPANETERNTTFNNATQERSPAPLKNNETKPKGRDSHFANLAEDSETKVSFLNKI